MRDIIDYRVLRSTNASEMHDKVLEYIGAGWQPLGGVSITEMDGSYTYVQAVVKYASESRRFVHAG